MASLRIHEDQENLAPGAAALPRQKQHQRQQASSDAGGGASSSSMAQPKRSALGIIDPNRPKTERGPKGALKQQNSRDQPDSLRLPLHESSDSKRNRARNNRFEGPDPSQILLRPPARFFFPQQQEQSASSEEVPVISSNNAVWGGAGASYFESTTTAASRESLKTEKGRYRNNRFPGPDPSKILIRPPARFFLPQQQQQQQQQQPASPKEVPVISSNDAIWGGAGASSAESTFEAALRESLKAEKGRYRNSRYPGPEPSQILIRPPARFFLPRQQQQPASPKEVPVISSNNAVSGGAEASPFESTFAAPSRESLKAEKSRYRNNRFAGPDPSQILIRSPARFILPQQQQQQSPEGYGEVSALSSNNGIWGGADTSSSGTSAATSPGLVNLERGPCRNKRFGSPYPSQIVVRRPARFFLQQQQQPASPEEVPVISSNNAVSGGAEASPFESTFAAPSRESLKAEKGRYRNNRFAGPDPSQILIRSPARFNLPQQQQQQSPEGYGEVSALSSNNGIWGGAGTSSSGTSSSGTSAATSPGLVNLERGPCRNKRFPSPYPSQMLVRPPARFFLQQQPASPEEVPVISSNNAMWGGSEASPFESTFAAPSRESLNAEKGRYRNNRFAGPDPSQILIRSPARFILPQQQQQQSPEGYGEVSALSSNNAIWGGADTSSLGTFAATSPGLVNLERGPCRNKRVPSPYPPQMLVRPPARFFLQQQQQQPASPEEVPVISSNNIVWGGAEASPFESTFAAPSRDSLKAEKGRYRNNRFAGPDPSQILIRSPARFILPRQQQPQSPEGYGEVSALSSNNGIGGGANTSSLGTSAATSPGLVNLERGPCRNKRFPSPYPSQMLVRPPARFFLQQQQPASPEVPVISGNNIVWEGVGDSPFESTFAAPSRESLNAEKGNYRNNRFPSPHPFQIVVRPSARFFLPQQQRQPSERSGEVAPSIISENVILGPSSSRATFAAAAAAAAGATVTPGGHPVFHCNGLQQQQQQQRGVPQAEPQQQRNNIVNLVNNRNVSNLNGGNNASSNNVNNNVNTNNNLNVTVAQFEAFTVYEDDDNSRAKIDERLRAISKSNVYTGTAEDTKYFTKKEIAEMQRLEKERLEAEEKARLAEEEDEEEEEEADRSDSPSTPMSIGKLMVNDEDTPLAEDAILNSSDTAMRDTIFEMVEYREDIYAYLREIEVSHRPKPGYILKQPDVTDNMRAILVDWLVEVGEEYKMQNETLYLAVNFIDRFLSYMSVVRAKLQLVGTAAMFIAAKYEEIYPPDVSEFVYITDDTYDKHQVVRMEHLILRVLGFDLSVPTTLSFINCMCITSRQCERTLYLAMYLSELAMLEVDPYLNFLPSTIAASAIALARHTLKGEPWTESLVESTGYSLGQLEKCITFLYEMFLKAPDYPQHAIQDKYKNKKYMQVSTLKPRNEMILFDD